MESLAAWCLAWVALLGGDLGGRDSATPAAGALAVEDSGTTADLLPPNIVFVLLDDVGYGDPGFHGGCYPTPRLDELSERSLDLRCHYAMHSCSPTRMAFLTGLYPVRFGALGLAGPIGPRSPLGIPVRATLLPARLQEAGYITSLVGKWHVGHQLPEHRPLQRGFDSFYGCYHNLSSYSGRVYRDGSPGWYRGEELEAAEGHTTDLIAQEAVRILESSGAETPLFLQVSFTAMHFPHQPRDVDLRRFEHLAHEYERNFAALQMHLDEALGRIIDAIARSERSSNTLLIISSDNGGQNLASASNAPFRGTKGQPTEGGMRAVALCYWPGVFEPGVVDDTLSIVDWYPTFAAIAGLPNDPDLDGQNIFDRLLRKGSEDRSELLLMASKSIRVIRRGRWKLISYKDGRIRLFDLAKDPGEGVNLAEDPRHEDLVTDLNEAAWSYQASED